MNVSFFPAPGPEPEPERFVPPPWLQPPADEYPSRVLVREFLAQAADTSLSVSHVDVYSTGLRIKVDWELRRNSETEPEWSLATGIRGFYGRGSDESQLRFGLAMADGSVVTTVDGPSPRETFNQRPRGWSLMDHMGGGGGDDHRYSGASRLWLWPLPPPGPLELVAEWRARKVGECRLVLDASALLDAVTSIRPLWA